MNKYVIVFFSWYLFMPALHAQQQEKQEIIIGKVVDEKREPLLGVSVRTNDAATSTVTDGKGIFMIRATIEPHTLITFSYLGMKTHTVTAGKRPAKGEWIIVMQEDETSIDEVVVTGYQNIRKNELTGSVKQLKADDILLSSKLSVDQMLAGQVAGMMVMTSSGEPSATPKIRIRGTSSLYSNKAPLWVLDGIILDDVDPNNSIDYSNLDGDDAAYLIGNAIAGINPQDIESINVLKDAAATALYGVQAANGVIVVTTKRGRVGAPRVSYNTSLTLNARDRYSDFNLMDASERIRLSYEIEQLQLPRGYYSTDVGYEGLRYQLNNKGEFEGRSIRGVNSFNEALRRIWERNTDWYDVLCRDALSHDHTVSLTGGNENTTYYASLGYSNLQGTSLGSDAVRYTAMSKLTSWLGEKLYVNFQLNGTVSDNTGFYGGTSPDKWAYTTSRTIPAYYDNGEPFYYQPYESDYTVSPITLNYLNEIAKTGSKGKQSQLLGKLDLRWNIWDKLRYEFSGSMREVIATTASWAMHDSYAAAVERGYNYGDPLVAPGSAKEKASKLPYGGIYNGGYSEQRSYSLRNQLAYEKEVAKDHIVSAQTISEVSSVKTYGFAASAYGWRYDRGQQISPVISQENFSALFGLSGAGKALVRPKITDNTKNKVSWLGFASYAYKAKAMLNANVRMDGSNQFGDNPKYRFLPVWSVSGRYILTQEDFLKDNAVLSYLALRGSYGVQGNVDSKTSPDLVARLLEYDTEHYFERSLIDMMPNADLRWEKTVSYNAGVDFSLWEKRLAGAVDFYHKVGTDMIMITQMSQVNGNNQHKINAGGINNTGIEFDLTGYLYRSKNWEASLNTVFAYNRNVLTYANVPRDETSGVADIIKYIGQQVAGTALTEGEAYGTLYSYHFAGLDHETGLPIFYENGKATWMNGDVETPYYYNLNYAIDIVRSGLKTPPITGAFNPALRYKNFRLRGTFVYSLGGVKRLPALIANFYEAGLLDPTKNVSREYVNRWKQPGDEAYTHIPAVFNQVAVYELLPKQPITAGALKAGVIYYDNSDVRVASTDNLRMNSLSLIYLLPGKLTKALQISDAVLMLQVSNLFLIADKKWNGRDPEQTSERASLPKTYSLRLTVNF
ncbi:MAG: SusC/RagA family TonB-linked outer membrane protein [Dysgonamonadaceae bacterium]|nr:SusC/RagA family TonB-linked outer membrane protein [Dysgonamonadaceae bacterium]